jgi:Holliday junction resolvase RusA-like endonuclease
MSRTIRLHVPGVPQPKGSPSIIHPAGRRPLLTLTATKEQRAWSKRLVFHVEAAAPDAPFAGPVSLSCAFLFPMTRAAGKEGRTHVHVRPDLDKLLRAVCDALERGGAITEDSRIVRVACAKRYVRDGETPGVNILVREL